MVVVVVGRVGLLWRPLFTEGRCHQEEKVGGAGRRLGVVVLGGDEVVKMVESGVWGIAMGVALSVASGVILGVVVVLFFVL